MTRMGLDRRGQINQLWRAVRKTPDSRMPEIVVVLVERRTRSNGETFYWRALDLETGNSVAVMLDQRGFDWEWEKIK